MDEDTAFALDPSDLIRLSRAPARPRGRYDLIVSRKDDEMPQERPGALGRGVELDPALYATSFEHWIRIHLHAKTIVTNRLHSAILGAIYGIPVTLMPGSYHKNRSVWEFSLKCRGVEWADAPLAGSFRTKGDSNLMPAFLRRSWKIQRLVMRLRGVPWS